MGWFILTQIFSVLIAIVSLGRLSEREKDLEILVLRQQLAIMKRKQSKLARRWCAGASPRRPQLSWPKTISDPGYVLLPYSVVESRS